MVASRAWDHFTINSEREQNKWFLIDILTKEGDTNNTHGKVMRDCDQNDSPKKKPHVIK